ncbi:MAG: amidohydrolase [Lentisphaerae bacterium]|jgi:uncharacterized protein|nr:amidohydrolase [Lentisphaerota bacterium]MBT4817349.1 amidohydrolase [Lentisphaerota bacterium]MBT5608135.1 amidohydrolase [Lentisphaerota bacterium]MBT7060588.1 amidohydrolase [Lentisphaerota bacterium]MBT7847687.1 amidohydrolase [Lentisphaerota bacterium]
MTVIDAHTHVWLRRAENDRRALLDCIESVPLKRLYVTGLDNHRPDEDTVVRINDAALELMRRDERVRGMLYLNPRHEKQVSEEFHRCRDLGFVMVKLWQATTADDRLNEPVYELCLEYGMPVLLHCFCPVRGATSDQNPPEAIASVARRHPELTVMLAHEGGDFIRGVEAVVGLPNVYVDFSGTYGERGMVDYAVEHLGADHVIFGSDMPGSDIYHNLGKVYGANLTEDQRDLVLWKNAERVLP